MKVPKKAAEKPARSRAVQAFQRVVAAAKRLLEVVYKNEGLANKELAKFETTSSSVLKLLIALIRPIHPI